MSAFRRITNPGLAALIAGAGFRSMERFAEAVNHHGWHAHGVRLSYDHVSVKRWLRGGVCRHADIVAEVISAAWGVPIAQHVVWPELRDGAAPVAPHLQVWTAARTLEDLASFIGSDMLTRREILAGSVGVTTGSTLLGPIGRWLDADPIGLTTLRPNGEPLSQDRHIGDGDVERLEDSIRFFAAHDAQNGGGLSREAAVGQLKYATDLVRYATYRDEVGNRLLVAIAGLAGLVGWMSLDSGMAGPAQRYLLYGLQAARESTDPRAPLMLVRLLADLAQHQRWTGEYQTAVRLHDIALSHLPVGGIWGNQTRSNIVAERATALAHLGPSALADVDSAVGLAFDLQSRPDAAEDEVVGRLPHRRIDLSTTELAAKTACAYLALAKFDHRHSDAAERHTSFTLAHPNGGQGRNHVQAQIRLARLRFLAGEPEQGCVDGQRAVELASGTTSTMVTVRLRELHADTEPYVAQPAVVDFRDQLRAILAT